MKIEGGVTSPPQVPTSQPARTSPGNQGRSFADALRNAVETPGQSTAPVEGQGITPPKPPQPALPPVWYQVGGLLDAMERYGQALGDPNRTLKEVEPLAAELEAQAQALASALQAGEVDPSLEELAQQALARAQVEALKFRRGDYL